MNNYFTNPGTLTDYTLARATVVNSLFSAVEAGMDKLPDAASFANNTLGYGTAGGSANAYTLTLSPAPTAYTTGMLIALQIPATNTGESTINVNALGVRSLARYDGTALAAGDLPINSMATFRYDGTVFRSIAAVVGDTAAAVAAAASASSSASSAASSASSAASSASAASTSASNAATSEVNAAASASAAAASAQSVDPVFTGTATFSASTPAVTSQTLAQTNPIEDVQYGDNSGSPLWVAVSSGGVNRIQTSPNGINWTVRTQAESNALKSVAYGGGVWVIVSSDGTNRVQRSVNGTTWAAVNPGITAAWSRIRYFNGRFVAVASSGTTAMWSTDGLSWTAATMPHNQAYYDLAWGNTGGSGVWVACGLTTNYATSADNGSTWTGRTHPGGSNGSLAVVYGGSQFVMPGWGGSNDTFTSADGVTWAPNAGSPSGAQWRSIAYGDGYYLACATNGATGQQLMKSANGSSWTNLTESTSSAYWRCVAFGGGKFVIGDNVASLSVVMTWIPVGTNRVQVDNLNANQIVCTDGSKRLISLTETVISALSPAQIAAFRTVLSVPTKDEIQRSTYNVLTLLGDSTADYLHCDDPVPNIADYRDKGLIILRTGAAANTGVVTMQIGTMGVRSLNDYKNGAFSAGQIAAESILIIAFDATSNAFKVLNLKT